MSHFLYKQMLILVSHVCLKFKRNSQLPIQDFIKRCTASVVHTTAKQVKISSSRVTLQTIPNGSSTTSLTKTTDSRWKHWILGSTSDSQGSMSRSLPLDWSVFFILYWEPSWVFWCGATVILLVHLKGTKFLPICLLSALPPWRSPPQHLWHLIKLRTALRTFSLRP